MRFSLIIRSWAPGVTAATLSFMLVACGGSKAADGVAPEASSTASAHGSETASATMHPTRRATSAGLSKARLIKRLRADPDYGRVPEKFRSCMADVLLKYSHKGDLRAYVSGSINLDKIKQLDEKKSEAAGWKCTKL